jgi:hypothetical protein
MTGKLMLVKLEAACSVMCSWLIRRQAEMHYGWGLMDISCIVKR